MGRKKQVVLQSGNKAASYLSYFFWLGLLVIVCTLLLLVYGFGWARFDFIRLSGDGHLAAKNAVTRHILGWKRMRYFTRTDRIASYILLNPWVGSVQVYKSFDGGLMVNLWYKKPIFRAIDGCYLVGEDGEVIGDKVDNTLLALPTYSGDQKALSMLYQIWQQLGAWQTRLLSVENSPYTGWSLQFNNKITVRLGTKQLSDRVDLFVKIATQWSLYNVVEAQVFDMRYNRSFTHKKIIDY